MFIDKKVLYTVSVSSLTVLLLALILPGEHSGRIASAVLLLVLAAITLYGVKKRSILSMNKREILMLMSIIGAVYLVLYYLTGLALGYYRSLNQNYLSTVVNYIVPVIIIVVASEVIRVVIRAQNDKIADVVCYIGCVIAETLIFGNIHTVTSFNRFMSFVGLTLFPAVVANLLYHYLSKRYGMYPNIVYRLLITLYAYIIPFRPAMPDSLFAFANLFVPIVIYLFIDSLYEKKRRYALVKKSKFAPIITGLAVAIMAAFVMLISNQFKYGALVIATESMTGELNKGDAAIFEQYDDQIIKEGQVIVFERNDSMIVHRVVDIQKINGVNQYFTKGDANEDIDAGYVTRAEIVGLVNLKVPYVGYPTLWLRSLFQ